MTLTESQLNEMKRTKAYFPYRVVTGVLIPDGKFQVFANATKAQSNNYARKNNGTIFRFEN